MPDFMLNRA